MRKLKGTGGALDLLSNLILIILGIILIWFGAGGGSLGPIFVVLLGIFLIITQIMALIG